MAVLYDDVDATSAAAKAVAIVRDAEVKAGTLAWFSGADDSQKATGKRQLAKAGIINTVRPGPTPLTYSRHGASATKFGDCHEMSTTDLLDALDHLPLAERLKALAHIAGVLIRTAAEDPDEARDAVDKLLTHIERAAGLRL